MEEAIAESINTNQGLETLVSLKDINAANVSLEFPSLFSLFDAFYLNPWDFLSILGSPQG